jgi:hypothetical protein
MTMKMIDDWAFSLRWKNPSALTLVLTMEHSHTLSFVTTVLALVKAVVAEWHKKKDYPTLSFFQYLGYVFAFIAPNDQYVTAIADHIEQKSYSSTCLHLSGGRITDKGMETLANALSKSCHLRMETEEEGKEDEAEEVEFVEGEEVEFVEVEAEEQDEAEENEEKHKWIQRPPLTLRRINLGWNDFQDIGVIALSKALESYEGIQILDLRGCNGIGRDGYEKLGELLVHHRTLNTLILSDSESDFRGNRIAGSEFVGGVSSSWAAQITDGHKEKMIRFEEVYAGNAFYDRVLKGL